MTKFVLLSSLVFIFSNCGTADVSGGEPSSEGIENSDAIESTIEKVANTPQPIEFKSLDGLLISGMLYETGQNAPIILLCHQAGYNLHEYDEIAPKLVELGFNCLAIDQRSGGLLDDFSNQTADRAMAEKLPIQYVDAEQDIIAAIDFCHKKYNQQVILWGSSYSSALALHIGAKNDKLKAVLSFSPGDYFGDQRPLLKESMADFDLPFFITSAKSEADDISIFLEGITLDETHVQFIPEQKGKHGSKALWSIHKDNAPYWEAVKKFLGKI